MQHSVSAADGLCETLNTLAFFFYKFHRMFYANFELTKFIISTSFLDNVKVSSKFGILVNPESILMNSDRIL